MTISSTTVKNSYSGDGSTTTFAYTFKIFQDSDIQVIIRSSNGTETTKTITTHYTVTGAGVSGGGSVIFTTGNIPTSTQTVVLRRNIPQTQSIDYIANDPFPAESHEEGLDRATMAIQQLQEEVTRSIKLSKTNTMTSTEFTVGASSRANKILAFDTNGELSVTQELGTNRGSWSSGVTYYGRDIVKDGSNNNVYLCNTTHTSTGTTPISSNADVAKWDLIVDAQSATNSANSAANHASNSSNFANNSSNSANTAANHASNSSNFANNASNSANTASTYLSSVQANANAAANSASNASNFANNSSNSANSAANHSANSSNFANNASNHASNSSNHASNSSNFANNSSNSANTSANHASNSSNFANNSSNSANASANHASNSANHASNSSNFANNSSNSANTSANHASNSSNFSNNSSNFANTASNAANAANSARDVALTLVDSFEDVYLGSKTTDPTLDNDGDALTAGDLYYNSLGNVLKYYTGSVWVSITSGGITDLVQDTTPQLGGNLDINTYSIVSTSNGNINITPNGTGETVFGGNKGIVIPSGNTAQRGSTTGSLRFNTTTGLAEYYTGSEFIVIDSPPTVTSASPLEVDSQAGGNITFTILGSNFKSGAVAKFIGIDATEITASTTTINSSSSISAVIARSSFVNAKEPYDVRIINASGLAGTLDNQINVDTAPSWSTASGQIGGSIEEGDTVNFSVTATDADSDTIVYSVNSGSLPSGLSLNSSNGAITGTAPAVTGDTTSSFTLRATANSKTADRSFNIVIKELVLNGLTSARAARSCKKIYDLGGAYQGSGANGLYWITNYGTISAEQHYCLMDSSYSSGGWTLLYAGSSARSDWAGTNYQFNLNNSATPSPTTLYARNRSGTFTPTTSDKFMLRRHDNNDFKVHTIGTWVAGSTWRNLNGHYNLATSGSTVDASGSAMSGFACFECCAGSGGCSSTGGDLCGFGKCNSNGCYNNSSTDQCFGGAWDNSNASLSWGGGSGLNNIEGTYVSYWFRRDSASE